MATCALVGAIDFNEQDFVKGYKTSAFDCVIAVDGGFAYLEGVGIVPDIILGDFDSLGYVPQGKRVLEFSPFKDKSDMEIGLDVALVEGYDSVVIYGALGGRLDHTMANIQLFAQFSEQGLTVTAISPHEIVRVLTGPGSFDIPARESGTVSVFAANDCAYGVTERGMRYSLDQATLTNRTSLGVSNELEGVSATVSVEQGTLYIFYPL